MKPYLRYILMIMALCVFSASTVPAASLAITPSGGGSFAVQGDSVDGVSGMDLTIGYDPAVLSAPVVRWGSLVSGALSTANTTIPGVVRIAIIRTNPFSGSGPVATLTFVTQGNSGGLTTFSAKLIDSKGGLIPVQASIAAEAFAGATAGTGASGPADTTRGPLSASSATTAAPTVSQGTVGLGTLSMPGDGQPRAQAQPGEAKAVQPAGQPEAAEAATGQVQEPVQEAKAEPVEAVEVKQTAYGSVLDRFRVYQGERTPEIMIALFSKEISPFIRQEPAIVISDGKATVRAVIDLSAIKGTSNNFALTGAKLVTLKRGEGSETWVLESLPQANTLKASVTVVNSRSVIDYPLTVVPPADAVSGKKEDFALFLKDSGAKAPRYDLNHDGRHDYLDDFIYTAHYLVKAGVAQIMAK